MGAVPIVSGITAGIGLATSLIGRQQANQARQSQIELQLQQMKANEK